MGRACYAVDSMWTMDRFILVVPAFECGEGFVEEG